MAFEKKIKHFLALFAVSVLAYFATLALSDAATNPVRCQSGQICPHDMICLEGGMCGRDTGNCPAGFTRVFYPAPGCLAPGEYACATGACPVSPRPGPVRCGKSTCEAGYTCIGDGICLQPWKKVCQHGGVCLKSAACAENKSNKTGPDPECV